MNRFAGSTITAAIVAVFALGAVAFASTTAPAAPAAVYNTPQALGGPGARIPLTPSCQRLPMSVKPAGHTVASLKRAMFAAFNIYQQVDKCNARRVSRVIRCAVDHPVTEAPADRMGYHDERGAAALVACIGGVVGTGGK